MPQTPEQIQSTLRKMQRVSRDLATAIDSDVARLDKALQELQRDLFELLVTEFLTGFATQDGALTTTAGNLARVAAIDRLFDRFRRSGINSLIGSLAARMDEIAAAVSDYFRLGWAPSRVDRIAESNAAIHAVIGVKDGKLIPGGYLDRLAQSEELRSALKKYMTTSIANRVSLRSLTGGLSLLVKGSPDADGMLQRYYRQYAYDTFNQVRELKARQFAESLGIRHFIYQGSVIETTRKFCRKRAGKVFTTKQAEGWKNDPDLIDKKTAATYNPLIERGRYNCRHWIDYISEEMAAYLLKQQKSVA